MIKEWRAERGISQVKLAEMLGVTLRTVSRWEAEGYKSRMLELALKGLEAPVLKVTSPPAPKSNEGEYISLLEAIGITIEEWHAADDVETKLGMMKKAARISPRLYKKAYEDDLKKAGMDDEDIEEWEGVV